MLRGTKALQELKDIILRDYGVAISDEDAEELGVSLLRLTRVAVGVLAREREKTSHLQARENNSLGAKTST